MSASRSGSRLMADRRVDPPGGRPHRSVLGRLVGMGAVVSGLFIIGSVLLLVAAGQHFRIGGTGFFGVGTGLLALTLGVRHAFDADHIAAIDNTTRKLTSEGSRPITVGFFFSLGHSTVVFVLAVLLGLGVRAVGSAVSSPDSMLHAVTGVIGTGVSGLFLYVIAVLNLVALIAIVKTLRRLRHGGLDEAELERTLQQRGLVTRVLGPFMRRIDRPWKMYPIGVLFGLGFDTATEIALLVVSSSAVVADVPLWAILSLPFLFAAGMSLFDSLDGAVMNLAYSWALATPVRKVYYNALVTGLSVVVAIAVGTIELLGLVGSEFGVSGPFWSTVDGVDLNAVGFAVVGLFVATWVVALLIWRFGHLERRWGDGA